MYGYEANLFDSDLAYQKQTERLKYLVSGNVAVLAEKSRSGMYVAITRARYSVAYVVTNEKIYESINLPAYPKTETADY